MESSAPQFPSFKPLELEDRDLFRKILWADQPETTEWTFTNLFIWRGQYKLQWSLHKDSLFVFSTAKPDDWYAFQPMGPARVEAVRFILEWLRDERKTKNPRIERADARLVKEIEGAGTFETTPQRAHFDYVYRTPDLIQLAGRKYHGKRNHINKFRSSHPFTYAALEPAHIDQCLDLTGKWCEWRRCPEDMSLMNEWDAVREALTNFGELSLEGGVILIDGRVAAFALGEMLNERTAVIHVEKADPKIPELYTMINQQFCEHRWADVPYVNREQDLDDPGLRQSKLSYQPDHLVEKFEIRLTI